MVTVYYHLLQHLVTNQEYLRHIKTTHSMTIKYHAAHFYIVFIISENVATELERLETNSTEAMQAVNQSFDALMSHISKRKQEVMSHIDNLCAHKKKVFREQQQLIEAEKVKVERDCEGLSPGDLIFSIHGCHF